MITVSVVLATPGRQQLVDVTLPHGSCAWDAVLGALEAGLDVRALSGEGYAPDSTDQSPRTPMAATGQLCVLDKETTTIGIYGLVVEKTRRLEQGDRVELYRPLILDPMEQRRRRALENGA